MTFSPAPPPVSGHAYYRWDDMSLLGVSPVELEEMRGAAAARVPYEDIEPILAGRSNLHQWSVKLDKADRGLGRLVERRLEVTLRYVEDGIHEIPGSAGDPDVVLEHRDGVMSFSVGQRLYDSINEVPGTQLVLSGRTRLGFFATRLGDPTLLLKSFWVPAEKLLRRGRMEYEFETALPYSVYTNRVFDTYVLKRGGTP